MNRWQLGICAGFGLFAYVFCFGLILYLWFDYSRIVLMGDVHVYLSIKYGSLAHITMFALLVLILTPLWEEALWRWLPIRVTQWTTDQTWPLWIVIIIVSAIFGKIHGSYVNIFIQGVAGIAFSWVFLKRGYLAAVTTHVTYNTLLFVNTLAYFFYVG